MRHIDSLPCRVREVEHTLITMPDGVKLAARLWLPENAEEQPVPALLEYIPYRKRDLTRLRDNVTHGYLAGHGYACIRVDLRGSGDSEGILVDQYRRQEMEDGLAIINWLRQQPWCNGRIGMMGISWGGFNSLQIAALRPAGLQAIISACSTDDLYLDNMHYMGGCLLTDNLSESTTMFSVNSCPPDPHLVGDSWRQMWFERLAGSGLWLDTWLRHQRRDAYWRHGSVCEDYAAIHCPVMAVGGWSDGYTNAIFRLLEHLTVPCQGLIGPWGHRYPHFGSPGPAIGFLQESLRWWDYWLKDHDTGIMDEPLLRAWMQESVPPTSRYHHRPGRWIAEKQWPSPHIKWHTYPLAPNRLARDAASRRRRQTIQTLQSPLSVGLFAGKWCSYTAAPDLPHDQRQEDGGALVYDSAPLEKKLEILGAPVLDLQLSANRAAAMVAVRLSDVGPDDKATRVTYALFNLSHRSGHTHPEPLEPERSYHVRIVLNHIAQQFPAGHRLRLSLSTSYWPLAWPPPEDVRLTIHTEQCALQLPIRPPQVADSAIHFAEPEGAPPPTIEQRTLPHHNWLVHRDLAQDISTLEVIKDEGVYHIKDIDLEIGDRTREWYTYQGGDFTSLRAETATERSFRRPGWSIRTTTRTVLTADSDNFYLHGQLDAYEGDQRVYSQNWQKNIPRDGI